MLISIMPSEIHKLSDFQLYSQNSKTLLCCGMTNDIVSNVDYTEIEEIPTGQEQRCLPQGYGKYLTLEQIEQGLKNYTEPQRLIAEYEEKLADAENALAILLGGVT